MTALANGIFLHRHCDVYDSYHFTLGPALCIPNRPFLHAPSEVNNRVSDLKTFDDTMDAVGWGEIAYPDVDWRYLIMPSTPLPGDGKSFDPVCV